MSTHQVDGRCSTTSQSSDHMGTKAQGPERTDRLGPINAVHTFAPMPFGDKSEALIELPKNRGLEPATVQATVEGKGFSLNSMWAVKIPPASQKDCGKPDAPRVIYSPPGAGVHHGKLVLTARWADGHVERVVVDLTGSSSTPGRDVFGSSTPVTRLTPLHVGTIGDQIVGSRHVFTSAAPMNLGEGPASTRVWFEGHREVTAAMGTPGEATQLEPGAVAPPIRLTYAPRTSGDHSGHVKLEARWADRHVETQSVAVAAMAHKVTEAPASEKTDPVVGASGASKDTSWRDQTVTAGQNSDLNTVRAAVDLLFSHQKDGVDAVEKEQGTYKAPPAVRPLWVDLAGLAITLGTYGLSALLERAIKVRLASMTGIGAKAPAPGAASTVARHPTQLPLFGPEEPTLAEIAGKPTPVELDPASQAGGVVTNLMYSLKTAVTTAAKDKIAPKSVEAPNTDSNGISQDAAIDYFSEQRGMLNDAHFDASKAAHQAYVGLMQLDKVVPNLSATVVHELSEAAKGVGNKAKQDQMRHTAAQWMAFRTRVSLGTENVPIQGEPRTTAKLDRARDFNKVLEPPCVKGLLDIHVRIQDGKQWVTGARVHGISWMIANRMLDVNLRAEHVPVRIVVNDGIGYITRDEAGRVRYSGFIKLDPDSTPGTAMDEKQELRTAQLISDRVLSKTLSQWGVSVVDSDDSSPRKATPKAPS